MSDAHPTKDSLLTELEQRITDAGKQAMDLIAYLQKDRDEWKAKCIESQRDVARWENAHQVAMVERDHFKQIAEINAQTVKDMQAAETRFSVVFDEILGSFDGVKP